MRTSGRCGSAMAVWGETRIFMAFSSSNRLDFALQISGRPQSLESIFGLMIHGAAGPLGDLCGFDLLDDLVDGGRARCDGRRDVGVAERAVALSVLARIQRNDRDSIVPRTVRGTRTSPEISFPCRHA